MRKYVLLSLWVLLFLSCSENEPLVSAKDPLLPKSKLILIDTKKIAIDSITDVSSPALYISINQKPIVIKRANTGENTIFKFSSFDNTEKWEVKIPTQGPNSIMPIGYGFLVNKDESILIHKASTFDFFKTTNTGEIVSKYVIDSDFALQKHELLGVNASPSSPIQFINNVIYFRPSNAFERTSKEYYQGKVIYGFDTETEQLYGIGDWPDFMKMGVYYGEYAFIHSYSLIGDTLVLSFPLDPNLHLYSIKSREKIGQVFLPSKNIKAIPPAPDAGLNLADESQEGYRPLKNMEYIYPIGQFWRLLYDEKANLLYRFVFNPGPLKDIDDKVIPPIDRPISVQVINSKLELLNEISLEKGKYNLFNTYAHDGKLYLELKPNLETDPLAEDFVIYEVMEFVEE